MSVFFGINKEVLPLKVIYSVETLQYSSVSGDFFCATFSDLMWTEFINRCEFCLQANLTIQEAKLNVAQNDLNVAQAQLDEKQAELDKVQAMYDKAVQEKQVTQVCDVVDLSRVEGKRNVCHATKRG